MKLKCPDCGSTIDVSRLREAETFRAIIEVYKRLDRVESALVGEYVDCFRASSHAEISPRKYLRILRETIEVLTALQFSFSKRTVRVDRRIALEALQKTVDTEKRAFRNHNYWFAIMAGMAKKRAALEERETDKRRVDEAERRRSEHDRDALPERGVSMPQHIKELIEKI